ncbi:MAG TPA: Asp-tRNA(Asn)/Glu-tRNA(Gln) amidotransferase subunit GatC [Candidatus Acidoferrales bacterium]|nr:Asp-tRNA(Asn)/Glu-tRNA(Gln) amidotransferase subunit GatC [Candidatus Acidoferrales bacterium]
MSLDRDTVRHIALLARLQLTDAEEAQFTEQLGHILEHFEQLAALDTEGIEPTSSVIDVAPQYRDDVVTNPPASEDMRANAPARDDNFFKVPKIIE